MSSPMVASSRREWKSKCWWSRATGWWCAPSPARTRERRELLEWWLLSMLYLGGFLLFFLELFIPSGGILAVAAVLCTGYAIFELFDMGQQPLAWICILMTLLYVVGLFRFWLRRIGHRTNLGDSDASGADVRAAASLLDTTGITLTDLRPAGMANFAGDKFDVVAEDGFIPADSEVTVVENTGNRIVVRRVGAEARYPRRGPPRPEAGGEGLYRRQ
ncbi:MAG TPA: hypothetical protein EYN00_09265, partial [Planctomycetes bacterium]|nr:hypothetical protein [Planctomycetota bacterium]